MIKANKWNVLPFVLLTSVSAHVAAEVHPFVGIKGGYQISDDDAYKHTDPKGYIAGVEAGLQFTPSWSANVGYQYHDDLHAKATDVNVKTSLIEAALRYDWNFDDSASIYWRLGAAYWDLDKTSPVKSEISETGFSPLGEIGLNYHVTDNVRLRAGYQYIYGLGNSTSGEYDSHAVIAGLNYHFGANKAAPVAPVVTETPIVQQVDTTLVPAVAPAPAKTEVFKTTIVAAAPFAVDSTKLDRKMVNQLDEVVTVLNANPKTTVEIVGHTDSTGSANYNQKLSEKRAQAAATVLKNKGVEARRIDARGEGEHNPVASNATKNGRAANRRIEARVMLAK